MKLLRFATVALLAGGMLVACDDDEPVVITQPAPVTPVAPPPPAPIVGSVSGTVSVEGSGLSGVTVGLVGAASQSATTGASGGYSFSNVPGGTHGVQISGFPAEVAFVSTAAVVTIATSGQTATADFGGNYIRTSTITGTVTAGGEGVVATVTATGAGMLMSEEPVAGSSNPDGDFQLGGLRAGTYHVTISDFGDIEFAVTTRDVTVGVGLSANVSFSAPGADPGTDSGAFVFISSVADADEDEPYSGQVTVTASVERGEARFEKLTLYVDGVEVDSQDFGVPASEPADEPETEDDPAMAAAQQVFEFELGFNSAAYDDSGNPAYMNGDHTVSVGLQITGGGTIPSNEVTAEFDNTDGVHVAVSGLGAGARNSDTGQMWYGGPASAIEIAAMPVLYSGAAAGAVGIGGFCGAEAATDAEAPFAFTPDCKGTSNTNTDNDDNPAGDTPAFTVAGSDVATLNGDDIFPLYLDFDGPSAPIFSPNPNGREDGWVNLTVDFAGEQGSKNEDGWLTYIGDDDEGGVGGYQPVLRYAAAKDKVKGAIAAAPLSLANLPGESEANAYCAVVSAVDRLGNESSLPDEDDGTCLAAGVAAVIDDQGDVTNAGDVSGYEELLEALRAANALEDDATGVTTKADAIEAANDALADAGLLVGVDITPPGIELEDDENRFNTGDASLDFDIYDDDNEDANSDLHSIAPLLASAAIRDSDDANCLDIGDGTDGTTAGAVGTTDDDCDDPTPLAENTAIDFGAPANAYYTVQAAALDKAGNYSAPISHTFVYDDEVATATPPAAPRIDAGEDFQVASFLNDDLSIRDYYVTANFTLGGDNIRLGVVTPKVVDAFDADPLTNRNVPVSATVSTYAGLQADAAATTVTTLTGVSVAVRDQADSDGTNDGTPATTTIAVLDAADVEDGFDADEDPFTVAFTSSKGTVGATPAQDVLCVAEDIDDCAGEDDAERETELEVVATATNLGAFSDPFDRVDFWVQDVNGASWLLGSDTSGESDRVGGATNDRHRTWTYSLDATAADLYMLTREAGFPPTTDSDEHTVRAFGVNDDGMALVASVTLDIDDGEDDQ